MYFMHLDRNNVIASIKKQKKQRKSSKCVNFIPNQLQKRETQRHQKTSCGKLSRSKSGTLIKMTQ